MLACLGLGLATHASAKSVWIAAFGINESQRSQNFKSFYNKANAFQKICKTSPLQPDCRLFINPDPSLAESHLAARMPPGTPPATSKQLLEVLEQELANAQPGDNIVLSLTNHGTPSYRGQSCVFLSSEDFICETDIKKVLDKKLMKPGVKLFINADACYSGAFVDLSSADVCVMVAADRRSPAFDANLGGIWSALEENPKIRSLKDLGTSYNWERYGWGKILSSHSMKILQCTELRRRFPILTKYLKGLEALSPSFCEKDPRDTQPQLATLLEVAQALERESECSHKNRHEKVCSFIDRLKSPEFKDRIAKLAALSGTIQKIWTQRYDLRPDMETSGLPPALSWKDIRYFANNPDLATKDVRKFSDDEQRAIQTEVEMFREELHKLKKKDETSRQEYFATLATLQPEFSDSIKGLSDCFFPIEEDALIRRGNKSLHGWGLTPTFPRQFTDKDIQEAQSCEESIQFR